MEYIEKKSGPSLGFVTERLLFPKIFRKISYFSGLQKIFLLSIVNKEIAWKSKWKYEQRDYAFSLFLSLTLKKKKVTESDKLIKPVREW